MLHSYKIVDVGKFLFGIVSVMLSMYLTGGAGFLIVLPFMLAAMSSKRVYQLFFLVLVSISMLVGNSFFMPKDIVFAISQRGILVILGVVMSVQIAGRKGSRILSPLLGILVYIGYMIMPSVNGWMPIISGLKLFLFTLIFLAFYGVSARMINTETVTGQKLRAIMLCIAIFFIVGSVLVIPFPAISTLTKSEVLKSFWGASLFKGMTSHSQCLGPMIAALGIIVYADMLFSLGRADKLYILLLIFSALLIYKTSSRTAMASFICGLSFSTFLFMRARGVRSKWRAKVFSGVLVFIIMAGVSVLAMPAIREGALSFAMKYTKEDDLSTFNFEEATTTRRGVAEESIANFKKKPVFGNGFQVSEGMSSMTIRSIGQILSAPVEKGVWVTAILEEGGVFGLFIFVAFVLTAITKFIARKAYVGASVLFLIIVSNLGEFTMFAMSFLGGFMWAMVFLGLVMDAYRIRETCEGMVAARNNWRMR